MRDSVSLERSDEFGIVDSCLPKHAFSPILDEIKMAYSKPNVRILLSGPVEAGKIFLKNSILGQSAKLMSKRRMIEDTMFRLERIRTEVEEQVMKKYQPYFDGYGKSSMIDYREETSLSSRRRMVEDTMFPSEGISTGIEDERKMACSKRNFSLLLPRLGAGKSSFINSILLLPKPMSKRRMIEDTIFRLERISTGIEGHKTFGAVEPDWRPKQSREKELRKESSEWTKPKDFKFHIDTHELEQLRKCKVCLDKDSCIIFFPCRHMATCESCEGFLQRCPICRSPINKSVKINEC